MESGEKGGSDMSAQIGTSRAIRTFWTKLARETNWSFRTLKTCGHHVDTKVRWVPGDTIHCILCRTDTTVETVAVVGWYLDCIYCEQSAYVGRGALGAAMAMDRHNRTVGREHRAHLIPTHDGLPALCGCDVRHTVERLR